MDSKIKKEKYPMDTYVCLDLETTGLNPKRDRVIEIGAVRVCHGQEVDCFSTFVNPGRRLDPRIVELTGICDDDLAQAPDMGEVLPELLAFLGEDVLVGHRISFDYAFVKKAALDAKKDYRAMGVDTLQIARKYLAEAEKKNLEYLCKYFQIPHKAHRALDDARATGQLYEILAGRFGGEEAMFGPQPLVCNIKRDTPATKAQKEQLCRLLQAHTLKLGEDGLPLLDMDKMTRSETSRLIDQILAKYGR
ncbi:MAG: 3'-5' exonuclease [Lachnospiraceae bacterium]|nr:3'-5' exonuclease [Lachnospiraceae bacterium]